MDRLLSAVRPVDRSKSRGRGASPGALARFSRAVPCVQVTFEREIRRVHALPRAPARAGGAASRPRRARAHRERRCGAHTDAREQPSASQQPRPPSTALGGSAATRAIHVWDRADQRRRTRPRPSRPAQPSGCSGHPAWSSSGRSTVPLITARGATWTRTTTTPRGGAAGRETTPHRPACTPSHFAGDCERPWGPKYQFNYQLF